MEKKQIIRIDDIEIEVSLKSKRVSFSDPRLSTDISYTQYQYAKLLCSVYESREMKKGRSSTLIDNYPFSVRAKNILKYCKDDAKTLGELKEYIYKVGIKHFMRTRNLGKRTFMEICDAIQITI